MLPEKRRRESRLSMEGRTFQDNASVALLAVSYEVCDVKQQSEDCASVGPRGAHRTVTEER
jgi:hypothetical protein